MKLCRMLVLGVCVSASLLIGVSHTLANSGAQTSSATSQSPTIADYHPGLVQHGSRAGNPGKQGLDVWNIYGGLHPDGLKNAYPEGEFQTFNWIPDESGWNSVDLTETQPRWHISEFNAGNLDAGAPNHAMFSGVEAAAPGYQTAPGYGNGYNDWLDWTDVSNPAVNVNVRLVLDFNYDTEDNFDFFIVEYDSNGVMVPWAIYTGNSRDGNGQFTTPEHFDQTKTFTPLMYSGEPRRDVHLRLRVVSDSAWSDEDGLFPSDGAAQVDNVTVYFNGNPVVSNGNGTATFEDLGGGNWDTEGWTPVPSDFVGDFGRVWPQVAAIDPCRNNESPQIGFIDDGFPPANGGATTGGSTSGTWNYGVPGGWVVNYTGGLTNGTSDLHNEYWSPEIDWDDPGTDADDALMGGAFVRFSVWQHMPLLNGMFWVWHVRSFPNSNGDWDAWQDRNFVYYSGNPVYNRVENDVSDLMVDSPEKIQIALGVMDLAGLFGFPGTDATPAPFYDAVSFWKFGANGPGFSARNIELFQDGFPNNGSSDWTGDLSQLSVRLDAAIDVNAGDVANVAGDSIVVDVLPLLPGTTLDGPGASGFPVLNWALETNPMFDGVRTIPSGAVLAGTSARGYDVYTGTTEGYPARTSIGAIVPDKYAFDPPGDGPGTQPHHVDEPAMFFPGDRFRYYIEARDSDGNTTTLPDDTTGFVDGNGYSRTFTVRALPSLFDDQGATTHPNFLVINDFGRRGGEATWLNALRQNGLSEDVDYDTYTVMGPSSLVGNGIGSIGIHGANGDQLGGYGCLLYMCGNLSSGLISDGSDASGNDKSQDVQVLTDWHNLPGDRRAAYFGDNIGSGHINQGVLTQSYLNNIMGVDLISSDVINLIGGQATPVVSPTGDVPGVWVSNYVAFGGCLSINTFDHIQPMNGTTAVRSHGFYDPAQTSLYDPAAGVWHERTVNIQAQDYIRVDATFPYGFVYIRDEIINPKASEMTAAANLMNELLLGFGHPVDLGSATGATPRLGRTLVLEQNVPNPFNPSTEIRFRAPAKGQFTVRVYNLRGELIRTLFDAVADTDVTTRVTWDGRDATGAAVSSGVYLYQVKGLGFTESRKMALVK